MGRSRLWAASAATAAILAVTTGAIAVGLASFDRAAWGGLAIGAGILIVAGLVLTGLSALWRWALGQDRGAR